MVDIVKKKHVSIAPFFSVCGEVDDSVGLNCHLPAHCQRRGHRITTVDQSDMLGLVTG